MIPGRQDREDNQTLSDLVPSSADRDQAHSDSDQTGSDRDQRAADLDQEAADNDQAACNRDLAQVVDGEAYDRSREARERTTQLRRETSNERHSTAKARDGIAHKLAAASHRARSTTHRADARGDRDRAASDRLLGAEDRVTAAEDGARVSAEQAADELDGLTGAPRLGPGLADMQREIDRANRGNGRLIVAYVEVDGLTATDGAEGHHVRDMVLKHIVNVLGTSVLAYESVVRRGGDEFVCTISGTTLEDVRQRFDDINADLSLTPAGVSISVGLAELVRGDSPMDLVDRADRRRIASRDTQTRNRRIGT